MRWSGGFEFSAPAQTAGAAAATSAILEIITSPTDTILLRLLAIRSLVPNTNSSTVAFLFGRPSTAGITPKANAFALVCEDSGYNANAPSVTFANEWGTRPAVPTNFLRRISWQGRSNNVPNTPPGVVFRFPRGISLGPSSSLAIWTTTADLGLYPRYVTELEIDG